MPQSRFWDLYKVLIVLRLIVSLQPSYLHPDEFFQTSEIAVSDAFGWPSIRTWEFELPHPIRSIIPIWLFQLPVLSHIYFFSADSPAIAFYAVRIQQWAWSLILDLIIYTTTKSQVNLLLFASSYSTLVYQTHTLSNAWESVLVLVTLYASQTLEGSLAMGLLTGLGFFTRPSFLFFLIPYGISRCLKSFVRDEKTQKMVPNDLEINLNGLIAITLTTTIGLGTYIDTFYHSGYWLGVFSWDRAIFTPLNNIWYNADAKNLATHGIHPRYQHLLNLGILLGPGVLLASRVQWKGKFAAAMVSGLCCLLLIPHQEPRFLAPVVCLFFTSLKFSKTQCPTRLFWSAWFLFNFLGIIGYGVLHQCGVIPASLWVSKTYPNASVTYNNCYPSPQFLVGPNATISHKYGPIDLENVDTNLLVMPVLSFREATKRADGMTDNWTELKRIQRHIDLDRIGEFGTRVLSEAGLGIYQHHRHVLPAAN